MTLIKAMITAVALVFGSCVAEAVAIAELRQAMSAHSESAIGDPVDSLVELLLDLNRRSTAADSCKKKEEPYCYEDFDMEAKILIGHGNQGAVYKVVHKPTTQTVAYKTTYKHPSQPVHLSKTLDTLSKLAETGAKHTARLVFVENNPDPKTTYFQKFFDGPNHGAAGIAGVYNTQTVTSYKMFQKHFTQFVKGHQELQRIGLCDPDINYGSFAFNHGDSANKNDDPMSMDVYLVDFDITSDMASDVCKYLPYYSLAATFMMNSIGYDPGVMDKLLNGKRDELSKEEMEKAKEFAEASSQITSMKEDDRKAYSAYIDGRFSDNDSREFFKLLSACMTLSTEVTYSEMSSEAMKAMPFHKECKYEQRSKECHDEQHTFTIEAMTYCWDALMSYPAKPSNFIQSLGGQPKQRCQAAIDYTTCVSDHKGFWPWKA